MEAQPKTIDIYKTADNRQPFTEWMDKHQKQKIWEIINARLARVEAGTMGQTRAVGEGVIELKISFGQGFRVYVGLDGNTVVLLMASEKGTKKSQTADIKQAKTYWSDYNA